MADEGGIVVRHLQLFPATVALLVMVLFATSACSTRNALKQNAKPETSWKLITPEDAPHYTLAPDQSANLPTPLIGHFAPPVYPPSLARPGMPPVLVKAQLVFGTDGRVREVVILSGSYMGPEPALFEDAVREAAQDWAFTPLVFEESRGRGGDPITMKREAKPFSLWFEFRFDMVNGKPSTAVIRH